MISPTLHLKSPVVLLHEETLLYDNKPLLMFSVLDICRVIELLDRLQRSGELPPPKLQALQRVLQSKFCAAIREVRTLAIE